MDDERLDEYLRTYRGTAVPKAAANLRSNVLREVRVRGAAGSGHGPSFVEWLFHAFVRPMPVAACLVAAATLGAGIGATSVSQQTPLPSGALGLEVFSASAQILPSTLLSENP